MSYPEPYVYEEHNRKLRERFKRTLHFLVSLILCSFKHDTLYWRKDANYKFCKRCKKWWHLEFYSNRTSEWVSCENQTDKNDNY